jgi:pimeloyl-ACP methyl ester carboxylesterase
MRFALAVTLTLVLASTLSVAEEASWDRRKAKAVGDLAERWWKARPPTKFAEWDPEVRAALVEEAKAFGKLPEGKLEDVVKALWKPVAKYGPRHARGKTVIQTPYGEAEFILNGAGRNKGLVIGLHGGGPGSGSASEATKWKMKKCIGIYPQGIRLVHDTWNTVHGERFVLTLIEIAKAQYQVDPDRVYVMGFSMGATGSWHMAGRHPDLFAGALPGNGVLMASPKSQLPTKEAVQEIQHGILPNVRNVAVWYFTGLEDTNCMPGTFLFANDRIAELRERDPGGYGKIHFQAYPGLKHAMPPGEPAKGIKFLEGETRETFPKVLVWEYAAKPFPMPHPEDEGKCTRIAKRYFHWLKCEKPRDRQVVRATIEDNVITLEGKRRGLTIFLNPEMIDVEEDVVVKSGETELYRGRPEPDVWTVLETLDAKVDVRMVFDRRIEL